MNFHLPHPLPNSPLSRPTISSADYTEGRSTSIFDKTPLTSAQRRILLEVQDASTVLLAACTRNLNERQNLNAVASLLNRVLALVSQDILEPNENHAAHSQT